MPFKWNDYNFLGDYAMVQYNDKLRQALGPDSLSLERAQQLKREARSQREYPLCDLESLMQEYQRKGDGSYYADLQGIDLVIAKVKEFFGRGREYEYRRHLQELGVVNGQLTILSDNTLELIGEYRTKMQNTRSAMYGDREVFGLNSVIYNEKEKQLNGAREELNAIEKESVLGSSCTTDSLRLHKNILELENDITELSQENDDLAVRIMVNNGVLDTQRQTSTKLQEVYGHIQRQRSVFNAHYELAQSQERMIQGLSGVKSATEIYMHSAVMIQQLKGLQEQLDRTTIDDLPAEFQLGSPRIDLKGDPSRPYWMTVAEQIRGIGRDV